MGIVVLIKNNNVIPELALMHGTDFETKITIEVFQKNDRTIKVDESGNVSIDATVLIIIYIYNSFLNYA